MPPLAHAHASTHPYACRCRCQVIANNVLKDPKQTRRVFKPRNLRDLLAPPATGAAAEGTETGDLFANAEHPRGEPTQEPSRPSVGGGKAREADGLHSGSSGVLTALSASSASGAAGPSDAAPSTSHGAVGRRGDPFVSSASSAATANRVPEETTVLGELLRGDMVATALDHDMVIGDSSRKSTGGLAAVEARKVAERAAAALKADRERTSRASVNVPTWTGRSGANGIPGQRRFGSSINPTLARTASSASSSAAGGTSAAAGGNSFFGQAAANAGPLGSSSLLQRIRDRQDASSATGSHPDDAASRLLRRMCDFFARRGGRCTSAQLVNEFQSADVDARLFKQLLKEAADKKTDGSWTLKPGLGL